jgi:hypothetical protein
VKQVKHAEQLELVTDEPRTAKTADEIHALAEVKLRTAVMPAIASAVARVTLKECNALFNARQSHIGDAIAFREINGSVRAFDIEWVVALLLAAPEATKLELLTALCKVAGYRAPERARELTDAEELRIWKKAVGRLAPGIVHDIEEEVDQA